ncbi:hypothetical protein B0H14DRAFT_2632137 [Mycena olivaceomarginata]|nr:hypothetical protein B0H14DRAFT_2632137 [Mycena olivaceomarginata]
MHKNGAQTWVSTPLGRCMMPNNNVYAGNTGTNNTIRVATPPWLVSDELAKNIYSYSAAVLLSTKLAAYKGNIPKNIVFAVLKKHRFDLPPGIEHNPADWGKVKIAVEAIGASLMVNRKDKTHAPKFQQKSIFELTTLIVENTKCEVNVLLLCARVAFMRKHCIKDSSAGVRGA